MSELVAFVLGLAVGGAVVAILALSRLRSTRESVRGLEVELARATERLRLLEPQRELDQATVGPLVASAVDQLRASFQQVAEELVTKHAKGAAEEATSAVNQQVQAELARLKETSEHLEVQLRETLGTLAKQVGQLGPTATSQLGEALAPRLQELTTLVDGIRKVLAEDQQLTGVLQEGLQSFLRESQAMRDQVTKLTSALSSSAKQRGDWGELVLANLLRNAGLTEPRDFEQQVTLRTDDRPTPMRADVVVHLPGDHHLVIDAKVQLVDYQQAVANPDDADARRRHARSLRSQVDELNVRRYDQALPGSLDGVFLFVPIDAALAMALDEDPALFEYATERGVFLATPTTLVPVLKVVALLWRNEEYDQRAREAMRLAKLLLKKLVGVAEALETAEKRLGQASESLAQAKSRFVIGKGNVASIAQRLAALDGGTSRALPQGWEPIDELEASDATSEVDG
jgi:DNA recombination protein RmuC